MCKSADIDVTPSRRKSNLGVVSIPAFLWNATKNPPKQQSTCKGFLYLTAILDNDSISSQTQWGKLGKDPTMHIVFLFIFFLTKFKSTW